MSASEEAPAAVVLGKRVVSEDAAQGRVTATFVAGDTFVNRNGQVFGGFIAAMLEALCGHAVRLTRRQSDKAHVALELKSTFIDRADTGLLVGEGWVCRRGRSIAFAEAELRTEAGALIARGSATFKVG